MIADAIAAVAAAIQRQWAVHDLDPEGWHTDDEGPTPGECGFCAEQPNASTARIAAATIVRHVTGRTPAEHVARIDERSRDGVLAALRRGTVIATCPACGPTPVEPHPRRGHVVRCANCGEYAALRLEIREVVSGG